MICVYAPRSSARSALYMFSVIACALTASPIARSLGDIVENGVVTDPDPDPDLDLDPEQLLAVLLAARRDARRSSPAQQGRDIGLSFFEHLTRFSMVLRDVQLHGDIRRNKLRPKEWEFSVQLEGDRGSLAVLSEAVAKFGPAWISTDSDCEPRSSVGQLFDLAVAGSYELGD